MPTGLLLRLFSTVLLAFAVPTQSVAQAGTANPDLLLFNAKIVTVDRDFSLAEAILIRDARIVAVGRRGEVEKQAGASTRRIDLKGRMVTPGFIDAHPHLYSPSEGVWLAGVKSVEDVVRIVAANAAKEKPGEWLVFEPLGEPPFHFHMPARLAEKRYPTREELDRAAPANPAYIRSSPFDDRPTTIFNSAALERLGITRQSGPIAEVEVVRLADGTPTGEVIGNLSYFSSSPLRNKLFAAFPRRSPESQVERLKSEMASFNAFGITAIYEGHGMPDSVIDLYKTLAKRGEITVRTYHVKQIRESKPIEELRADLDKLAEFSGAGAGDEYLRVGGAFTGIGDNVGFGAGLMNKPYLGPHGRMWEGLQLISEEKLYELTRAAAERNIRMNFQASGQKAIDVTLRVIDRVNKEIDITQRRFVLQHCQFPSEQNMLDVVRLGVVPTVVTNFLWGQGNAYLKYYGPELANQAIPLKTWLRNGVPIALSSDYGPHDAMFILWQAIARKNGWTGETLGSQEAVSREDAIRMFTINAARVAFWEDKIGSLEVGKLADLVILDRDILGIPLDDIRSTRVLATLVGGKLVHGRLD